MMWSNSFPYHDKYEIVEFFRNKHTHTHKGEETGKGF